MNLLHPYRSDSLYSGYKLAKGTFDKTKMAPWCVAVCSNQSRLSKNVSYHKIPGQESKDVRAIARPVLSKAMHVCSDYFSKVDSMKAKN